MTEHDSPHLLAGLKGGLIVSCQAYPGEPMHDARTMMLVAQAAIAGGAVGIRAQGLEDIDLIHRNVPAPQIGLWKVPGDDVFITPTLQHAFAVADAGAQIVAIDGTRRPRPDGLSLAETITRLHAERAVLIMADCGSLDDGLASQDAGADIIGTTLSGYTGERPRTDGPDLDLLHDLTNRITGTPVVAEGRIHTPDQAAKALRLGAYAVVVGTAITHPTTITSWYVHALTAA